MARLLFNDKITLENSHRLKIKDINEHLKYMLKTDRFEMNELLMINMYMEKFGGHDAAFEYLV